MGDMQRFFPMAVHAFLLVVLFCACTTQRSSIAVHPSLTATVKNEPPSQWPTGPSAFDYQTTLEPQNRSSQNPVETWIRGIVENTPSMRPADRPHADARLDYLAFDVTFALEKQPNPDAELVTQLLSYYGIPNPSPAFLLFRGQVDSDLSSLEPLREQIQQTIHQGMFRRYGFGLRQIGTSWVGALAFVEQGVELKPIPRTLSVGQSVLVSGKLLPPFSVPEVLLTPPKGPVRTLVKVKQGLEFKTQLICSKEVGMFRVEVLGTDENGPAVLANFPLYCGIKPLPVMPWSQTNQLPEQDPTEVEKRVFALVGEARKQNGLPPLRLHEGLSQIARNYSQEMAASQIVAHVTKQSGGIVERVRAGGIQQKPTVLAENVGRAYSAREAHQGFMSSPGHLSNILHPLPTHIGIGVVRGQQKGELHVFYITQIFAAF